MASAHETLEQAEHAAHAGHSGKTGTYIGLTMAVLGVMLALCSALVGAERTEIIKTMVEQQNAHAKYQAQNTKYRMVLTQLLAVHSSVVTPAEAAAVDSALDAIAKKEAPAPAAVPAAEAKAPVAAVVPAGASQEQLIEGLKIATHQITEMLSPGREDVLSLVAMSRKYKTERDAAKEWAESFDESVHAHGESAEHYEWGQLGAEIGIVIASIALLMSSRKMWGVSLVLGGFCLCVIGHTRVTIGPHIAEGEHKSEETGKVYAELRKAQSATDEDDALVASIEAALGPAPKHAPATKPAGGHGSGEHGSGEHGATEHAH
jgi:hypothetical protein